MEGLESQLGLQKSEMNNFSAVWCGARGTSPSCREEEMPLEVQKAYSSSPSQPACFNWAEHSWQFKREKFPQKFKYRITRDAAILLLGILKRNENIRTHRNL